MYTKKGYKCCDKYDGQTNTIIQESGKHYAKAVCKYCNHFLKWLPNPNITDDVKKRNVKINKYIQCDILNEKQKKFLEDIQIKRFLTPKQSEYLQSIKIKYKNNLKI
jgi:hypothetical protein